MKSDDAVTQGNLLCIIYIDHENGGSIFAEQLDNLIKFILEGRKDICGIDAENHNFGMYRQIAEKHNLDAVPF